MDVDVIRNEPIKIKNTIVPKEPASADALREIYLNKVEVFVSPASKAA